MGSLRSTSRFTSATTVHGRTRVRRASTGILFAISLATFALVACSAVPDSGPVREGLENLSQVERGVQFNPPGPQAGASQEEIVRGFVRAASSSLNDYAVAREFLAPEYAREWDPSLGVIVDEGTQSYEQTQENVAELSLRAVAQVDENGALTPAAPGGDTELPYELVQVGGEWRISAAPAGIVLDRNTFNAVWTPRPIYYLSGDNRIVADWHWFLNRPTLVTQIVRELLHGPSASMAGALHTAVPQGTVLGSSSVPVVDGVAMIDLSPEYLEADDEMMQQFKLQLAMSLQPLGITGFQLSVNGGLIDSGEVAVSEETPSSEHEFVSVLKDGEFGAVTSAALRPIEGVSDQVVALEPVAVTMAPDRSSAAVLNNIGVSWVGDGQAVLVQAGSNLLAPSLDFLGYVWVYDRLSPAAVSVTKPGENLVKLDMPWLDGDVVALRVSIGGNRIAALVEQDGGSVVLVAGIVRDADGAPVGFTPEATPQFWSTGAPIDLDWIGDTRFAALTSAGLLGSSGQVTLDITGQLAVDSGAVAGGTAIAGGSRSLLRVLDDQHKMFWLQGSSVGWQLSQSEVQLIAKVG